MARSNKPLVWSLFAAGGTLAAFAIPALVLVTLMAGFGFRPSAVNYGTLHAFAAGWLGKGVIFVVIALCLWHAAHRARTALHGLGLRADKWVARVGYAVAGLGSLMTVLYLLRIQ